MNLHSTSSSIRFTHTLTLSVFTYSNPQSGNYCCTLTFHLWVFLFFFVVATISRSGFIYLFLYLFINFLSNSSLFFSLRQILISFGNRPNRFIHYIFFFFLISITHFVSLIENSNLFSLYFLLLFISKQIEEKQ